MRAILRAFAPLLLACLPFSSAPAFGAWPPTADAPPESLYPALLAEVRAVARTEADVGRRGWAWRALRLVEDPELATLHPRGLADPSGFVRSEAVHALTPFVVGESDSARAARRAINAALRDPSPRVRYKAETVIELTGAAVDWSELELPERVNGVATFALDGLRNSRKRSDAYRRWLRVALRDSPPGAVEELLGYRTYLAADAPAEWKESILAAPLASPDPEVRLRAIQAAASDPVERLERCVSDPDPLVRRGGFEQTGLDDFDPAKHALHHDRFRAAHDVGLRDESNDVVRAALASATRHALFIAADRSEFERRSAEDDFDRVDVAIGVLFKLAVQGLSGRERVAWVDETRATLSQSSPGSRDRRLAAGLLSRFVLDHYGDGTLDGNEQRRRGRTGSFLSTELGMAPAARAIAALAPLAADSDPYVRYCACRAIASGCDPALFDGKLDEATALAAWRGLPPLVDDPRREIVRALAPRLQFVPETLLRDQSLRADLEAAALKLLADEDPFVARGAARYFMRRAWRPEVIPVLLAELRDVPESRDFVAERVRDAAGEKLLTHAPDSVPIDLLVEFLGNHPYVGYSSAPATGRRLAVDRLLELNAVDQYVAWIDARSRPESNEFTDLEIDLFAAGVLEHGTRWDAADVSAVLRCLAHRHPEGVDASLRLVWVLKTLPAALRAPLAAFARSPETPTPARCAAASVPDALSEATLVTLLAADDPVVALVAFDGLRRRERLGDHPHAPPSARALLAEAVRRRATE